MLWLPLALATALTDSLKDVFSKRSLRGADVLVVAWGMRSFALALLVPATLLQGLPEIAPGFWWVLALDGGLNAIATYLYVRALNVGQLSLTVPMLTFTPLFLLLTSPLMLGELPGIAGLIGVLLIVAGSWLLNVGRRSEGLLAPFRALLRDRGPRLMLLVALIFSVTSNLDKMGVARSSPLTWSLAVSVVVAMLLMPGMLVAARRGSTRAPAVRDLVIAGCCAGLVTVLQMAAIELTLVAYAIAIKRTSAVSSVLMGHWLFGEPGLRERLGGAMVMLLGVALIVLG